MKRNVSKTKELEFSKKCKNMSTKQGNIYDVAFKHGHFFPILILHAKMVDLTQEPGNTTVHWF